MATTPAKKFRIGSLEATIWDNADKGYSVQFSKPYKDGDTWKRSDRFRQDELLNIGKLAERAESWIAEQRKEEQG